VWSNQSTFGTFEFESSSTPHKKHETKQNTKHKTKGKNNKITKQETKKNKLEKTYNVLLVEAQVESFQIATHSS
jgi:hypothetical protein